MQVKSSDERQTASSSTVNGRYGERRVKGVQVNVVCVERVTKQMLSYGPPPPAEATNRWSDLELEENGSERATRHGCRKPRQARQQKSL